jgi:hypothetical protein
VAKQESDAYVASYCDRRCQCSTWVVYPYSNINPGNCLYTIKHVNNTHTSPESDSDNKANANAAGSNNYRCSAWFSIHKKRCFIIL